MRYCRECGTQIPDGKELCEACQKALYPKTSKTKKTSAVICIVLGSAIVLAAVLFAAAFFLDGGKENRAAVEQLEALGEENTEETVDAGPDQWTVSATVPGGNVVTNDTNTVENTGVNNNDYILPDSSTRRLEAQDVANLTKQQLRIARNEIYARHGRKFLDAEIQAYFNSKAWYRGTVEASAFSEDMLSQLERDKIKLIESYE